MSFAPRDPRRFATSWTDLIMAVGAQGLTVTVDCASYHDNPEPEAHRLRSEFYQFRSSLARKVNSGTADPDQVQLKSLSDGIMAQLVGKTQVRFVQRDLGHVSLAISQAVREAESGTGA